MRPIVIESPFAGNDINTEQEHREYLQECIRDCLLRGETPYASHQMLTYALDDTLPEERELGIFAGYYMADLVGHVAVYMDLGMSKGMRKAVRRHEDVGLFVTFRRIR